MIPAEFSALRLLGEQLEAVRIHPSLGSPSRPRFPFVLLHEGLGSVGLWRTFPDRLHEACHGVEVFSYSRHGYGASSAPLLPRPVHYMHHEADVILPAVLYEAGIRSPILVGHSDGASIALLYAGALTQRPPAALILIAPHVFVEDITIAAIRDAGEKYRSGTLRERLGRHHTDVDTAFVGWNDVWLSAAFRTWNIEDRLGTITCPVLLLQGSEDPYGTVAQLDAIEAAVQGPTERVMVHGCGHAPHLEQPGTVVHAINSFLKYL